MSTVISLKSVKKANIYRLRTCFEEDPHGEITQLALWSAYNEAFAQAKLTRPLMQAKDFITNVSSTFTTAQAQVVYTDPDPSKPKYTIRGVKPRAIPVDLRGRPYLKCLWKTPPAPTVNGTGMHLPQSQASECDFSVMKADEMWDHVMSIHFHVPKDTANGKYKVDAMVSLESNTGKSWSCNWGGCTSLRNNSDLKKVLRHTATHLPDTSLQAPIHKVHNVSSERVEHASTRAPWAWMATQVDERGEAAGVPLASVLVLRNLARQMGKLDEADQRDGKKQVEGRVQRCFGPVREGLGYVGAWNRSLRELMPPLEFLVERGLGLQTLPGVGEGEVL